MPGEVGDERGGGEELEDVDEVDLGRRWGFVIAAAGGGDAVEGEGSGGGGGAEEGG